MAYQRAGQARELQKSLQSTAEVRYTLDTTGWILVLLYTVLFGELHVMASLLETVASYPSCTENYKSTIKLCFLFHMLSQQK